MNSLTLILLIASASLCLAFETIYFFHSDADVHVAHSHNDHAHSQIHSFPSNYVEFADLLSRLSGLPPMIHSDNSNSPVPTALFHNNLKEINILKVHGGSLPTNLKKISDVQLHQSLPSILLEETKNFLTDNGMKVNFEEIYADVFSESKFSEYINKHEFTIVLHHDEENQIRRKLLSSVAPLTEAQISQYQIVLWTVVATLLITFGAISSIVNMEVIPDSLLMAKFQSQRTGKQD